MNLLRYRNSKIFLFIKIFITFFLLIFIYKKGVIDFKNFDKLYMNIFFLITAFGAFFLAIILSSLRFWVLLHGQEIPLSYINVFNINMISLLMVTILPGGGLTRDITKAMLIIRSKEILKSRVILTIINDRVIGIVSLFTVLCILGILILYHSILLLKIKSSLFSYLFLIIFCFLFISFSLFILYSKLNLKDVMISRFYFYINDFILLVKKKYFLVIFAFLLSILSSIAMLASIVVIGISFAYPSLKMIDYAFAGGMAMVSNFLPLTPGGLGIGEVTFNTVCHWLSQNKQIENYGNSFLMFRVISFIYSLYGIFPLFFRFFRESHGAKKMPPYAASQSQDRKLPWIR